MVESPVKFYSIALFKIASLILALLLGLQLIRSSLPFAYDINSLFTAEQILFLYVTLIVTLLALIEGLSLRKRAPESAVPVILLIAVFVIGMYFVVQIVFFDYNFDNSDINAWLGYYLLFGTFLIFVNARQVIFARFFSK
jgi:uncharacterized membrane protein